MVGNLGTEIGTHSEHHTPSDICFLSFTTKSVQRQM